MAYANTHIHGPALRELALAPFRALGRGLVAIMESNSRVRRAEALHAMSDAQLAQLGIKRDEIAHHVFRDLYGI